MDYVNIYIVNCILQVHSFCVRFIVCYVISSNVNDNLARILFHNGLNVVGHIFRCISGYKRTLTVCVFERPFSLRADTVESPTT